MNDSVSCSLQDAKTIVARAMLRCPAGETRSRMEVAHAALRDALEQRQEDVTRRRSDCAERYRKHFEVLADTLATPSTREPDEAA